MQEIDFLPARYRERKTRRKTQLWRMTVMVMLGAVVGAAALGQLVLKQSVAYDLQSVEGIHTAASARNMQFASLQAQLHQAESNATLYAYLNHPWPRTQILQELTASVPDTVVLHQLSIISQVRPSPASSSRDVQRKPQKGEATANNLPPAQRDFEQLQLHFEKHQLIARVAGVTSLATELHAFITSLNNSPLFVRAELTSLESVEEYHLSRKARFEIRVLVLSPHASKDAPSGPVRPRDSNIAPAPASLAPPIHAAASDTTRKQLHEES